MSETASFDTGALADRLGSDESVLSRLLTAASPATPDTPPLAFATYSGIPCATQPCKATSEQGAWRRNGTVCVADNTCSGIVFSQTQLHAKLPQFVTQTMSLTLENGSQYKAEVSVLSQSGFKIQCMIYGYPDVKVTMIKPDWWLRPASSGQQTYQCTFSNQFTEASANLVFVVEAGGLQAQKIYAVQIPTGQ